MKSSLHIVFAVYHVFFDVAWSLKLREGVCVVCVCVGCMGFAVVFVAQGALFWVSFFHITPFLTCIPLRPQDHQQCLLGTSNRYLLTLIHNRHCNLLIE